MFLHKHLHFTGACPRQPCSLIVPFLVKAASHRTGKLKEPAGNQDTLDGRGTERAAACPPSSVITVKRPRFNQRSAH